MSLQGGYFQLLTARCTKIVVKLKEIIHFALQLHKGVYKQEAAEFEVHDMTACDEALFCKVLSGPGKKYEIAEVLTQCET